MGILEDLLGTGSGVTGSLLSPSTDIYGNKLLSPDTHVTATVQGNKLLSPDTSISGSSFLSPNIEQGGLFNLKGTLDASTKKQATVNTTINILNSPFASASAKTSTGDQPTNSLLGGLNLGDSTTILLVGGAALIGFAILGGMKK